MFTLFQVKIFLVFVVKYNNPAENDCLFKLHFFRPLAGLYVVKI